MNKVISHYRLAEELGRGGMGTVYKAYDTTLDRTVVLKLLSPEMIAQEASRKRFLREARLASALDHPNICTIYETAEADKECFIAMQYIEGRTLKRVIAGRPLDIDSILAIALQVADAIATAHARGIIHRDIKSGNIIITPRGQAKVLDFGLAKLVNEKGQALDAEHHADELTRLGSPIGTPSYMSPEQARGERADHRSDIYSFGVVLYEMAAGRLPFRANSTVDMMHAVIHETPKPLTELNPAVPAALASLVERTMAKNAGDRYQSMTRLIEDLQSISRSLQIGSSGVPDGITVPYVVPSRPATSNPVKRFFNRMFARKTDTPSSPVQPITPVRKEATPDLSIVSGPKKSLAVLPFRNLGGDATSDFYGMSLADSIIIELAGSSSVVLIPSAYVARYQGHSIDPEQVRSELGADMILMGNFIKAGDRLRVTAQLVDAAGGQILWSEKIDADAEDVLSIQDRISQRILAGLSKRQVAVDPTHLLRDEDEEVRLDAVRTLEFSHDPRALAALVEALRDASLKVKSEAVRVLVKLGEEATGPVIQLLNDSLDEGDYLTARFAAKALGMTGDRSISPVLVELLGCEDSFVACESALALGRLREYKSVPELIDLLDDTNGNMRFAAAEALGHICDSRAEDALRKRLNDEDEGVRAKARWALSRLRLYNSGAQIERKARA